MKSIKNISVNMRIVHTAVLILFVLGMLPLFAICPFTRMTGDDFWFSTATHNAWIATHNIFSVLIAAAKQTIWYYFNWQGGYADTFIGALQTSIFGSRFYGFGPAFLLLFFCFSNFYFFRSLFGMLWNRHLAADITASLLILVSINFMPSPLQSFYWWDGGANYTVFYCMGLILTANYLRILHTGKCSLVRCVLLSLLAIPTAGGNPLMVLVLAELTCLYLLFLLLSLRKTGIRTVVTAAVPALIELICSGVNLLAPGYSVRINTYDDSYSPVYTVLHSMGLALDNMQVWIVPVFVVVLLLLIPVLWKECDPDAEGTDILSKIPLGLKAIVFFLLYASSFAPNVMLDHNEGALRCQNMRMFFLFLLFVLLEVDAIRIIKQKLTSEKIDLPAVETALAAYVPVYLFSLVLITGLLLSRDIIPQERRDRLPSICAVRSILIGEAQGFAEEMDAREEVLATDIDPVTFDYPEHRPRLIYSTSLDLSRDYEKNSDNAEYYGKTKIWLEHDGDASTDDISEEDAID